jgi:uroporphyrinogen-III decarboxylase
VALEGGWVALGDSVMWLCGMERILYGQMDEPEFIDQVLEAVHQWEIRRIECLIQEGIDILVNMAWYETTDFWTPKNWRVMIKPRLRRVVQKAHDHGIKFRYIITKSWQSYRQDFLELGVDCLTGVDPVQDKLDLAEVKRAIGEQICLMGGVNSAVMLTQWSDDQIRQAVDHAIEALSPGGGFILYPVDAIFNTQSWEKVEVLIEQWKRANR